MSVTFAIACLLLISYFAIERWLRKGTVALSLQASKVDGGSSKSMWLVVLLGIVLLIIAPFLNDNGIGYLNLRGLAWLGILSMSIGLFLRYWAAKVLGASYTRTLQIVEGQQLINSSPYNIIRHPGYCGTLLIDIGAACAINNAIVILLIAIAAISWRVYRIKVEEEMLATFFTDEYAAYTAKTWKLIPLVY